MILQPLLEHDGSLSQSIDVGLSRASVSVQINGDNRIPSLQLPSNREGIQNVDATISIHVFLKRIDGRQRPLTLLVSAWRTDPNHQRHGSGGQCGRQTHKSENLRPAPPDHRPSLTELPASIREDRFIRGRGHHTGSPKPRPQRLANGLRQIVIERKF
jgi:hypothetical protein